MIPIKKVSIKLPDDHPLFEYPAGERSRIAREWIQTGMTLTEILTRLEAKLDKLLVGQVILPEKELSQPEADPHEERMSKIAASLLDALEEWEKTL